MARRLLALIVLLCTLLAAPVANAQQPDDKQIAQKHFEQGRQLLQQNDYKAAIREFQEVLKHGKSVGALLNLGQCYEGLGDYRKALDSYAAAEELAATTKDDRRPDALASQTKLRDAHPWIRLRVRPDAIDLEGLTIAVDDVVVPRDEYNGEVFTKRSTKKEELPRHVVKITTRDREPATLTALDGETADVKLELLRARGDSTPPPPPPPGGGNGGGGGEGWPWQKWAGTGLMIGSLLPLALSAVWTAAYFSDRNSLEKQYQELRPDSFDKLNACTQRHTENRNSTPPKAAQNDACTEIETQYNANESQAKGRLIPGYVIGGVMFLGGLTLYLTAPSTRERASAPAKPTIRFVPALNGGMVVGTF